jgi:predicted molibdopterin-dependent oxidoreductase YjgC
MFRRTRADADAEAVTITLDDREIRAMAGESVAAALLAAGVNEFRGASVSGAPSAPYCMIGNCFECLVEIDGWPDRQACLVAVSEGMRVRRQMGKGA